MSVPDDVLVGARRVYLKLAPDDEGMRRWAANRWGGAAPPDAYKTAFWVLSVYMQDRVRDKHEE